jgi:uncharacterized membrane protein
VGKAATTGRASAWHAMAGVCITTPAMMAVVYEAKDECEKNKGEFSVQHDLHMKLSSFPMVLMTCLELNYSSNCEAKVKSLFIDHWYLYMYEGVEKGGDVCSVMILAVGKVLFSNDLGRW